ncbi:MAG: serine/threonine-protein phosphatase [Magnetococcales bacterium]|nr:serine/threonine-protein phosphatase [Magnetococcales bacterium]
MSGLEDKVRMAGLSDTGRVRDHNEDRLFFDAALGLALVADGVGGHQSGEVASSMAANILADRVRQQNHRWKELPSGIDAWMRGQISETSLIIHQTGRSQPQYHGMGATLVAALFFDNRVTIGHVGDSRLYRLRGSQFTRLTTDHTLLQQLLDQGRDPDEVRSIVNPHMLYQAMGTQDEVNPDSQTLPVELQDRYLLCSDGLTDMVEEKEMSQLLASAKEPEEAVQTLVERANLNGGRDNVTVVSVWIDHPFPARSGWLGKFFR